MSLNILSFFDVTTKLIFDLKFSENENVWKFIVNFIFCSSDKCFYGSKEPHYLLVRRRRRFHSAMIHLRIQRWNEYWNKFEYFLPNIDIRIRVVDIFRIRILFEYSNILVWIFRNYLMEKYLNSLETKTKFGQYSVSKE